MKLLLEIPKVEEYLKLRESSGMGGEKSFERAKIALENSLLNVCIYEDEELIGFGRIVGDGGITYVVSDIMVDKNHQRKGIGNKIMEEIDRYFEENCNEECYITLTANKPADSLYSKFKFDYYEDWETGMKRKR